MHLVIDLGSSYIVPRSSIWPAESRRIFVIQDKLYKQPAWKLSILISDRTTKIRPDPLGTILTPRRQSFSLPHRCDSEQRRTTWETDRSYGSRKDLFVTSVSSNTGTHPRSVALTSDNNERHLTFLDDSSATAAALLAVVINPHKVGTSGTFWVQSWMQEWEASMQ
jgi:hypothetical protein